MSDTAAQQGYLGPMQPNTGSSEVNAGTFLVNQILNQLAFTALVRVVAVSNAGSLDAVGFVDVQPMVNQIDGYGLGTPHGIIANMPYFRLQGGADAIILDPHVGDIGIAVFCTRDISNVKKTKQVSNPASLRTNDWADGLYIGGVLNGVPTQYICFIGNEIQIIAREQVTITAPVKVTITSPIVETSGEVRATGEVTSKYGTVNFNRVTTHTHPSNGAPPTPGT